MKRSILTVLLVLAATGTGRSQSIDPRQPAPLKPGLNSSMVDSTVGTQYRYFVGGPGQVHIVARWVRGQFDVGSPAPLDVAMFDESRTSVTRRQITPEKEHSEARIGFQSEAARQADCQRGGSARESCAARRRLRTDRLGGCRLLGRQRAASRTNCPQLFQWRFRRGSL